MIANNQVRPKLQKNKNAFNMTEKRCLVFEDLVCIGLVQ